MRALPIDIGTLHFVGIGGIGMSGIAEILHNLGHKVQGSDSADGANVRRLQECGQVLIDIGDNALDLLQGTRTRICLVVVVERCEEIQILAGLVGNVLNGSGFGRADLVAGLQRGDDGTDVQCHLDEHRQIGKSDVNPLGAAARSEQRN